MKWTYWKEFTYEKILCKNCFCTNFAQNMLYVSQIPNFIGEHSDTFIHNTLEKSRIVKILRKESIFEYSSRHNL